MAIRACRRSGNDRVVKHYRWRRWRPEGELIIGLSDQCERNYPLDRSGSEAYLQYGKQQHDIERRTAMNLQMGDAAPYVELEATEVMLGTRKHNGGALTDLFQAIARSTACSSRVFYGLLAWANLNAQMADASSL